MPEDAANPLSQDGGAADAVAVADDDLGMGRQHMGDGVMRHRMHVDDNGPAEARPRLVDQLAQRLVIGAPIGFDPTLRLGQRDRRVPDRPGTRDNTGNHPKPGDGARRGWPAAPAIHRLGVQL